MKKAIIAFLAMTGALLPAMAQETVTGVVVDKKGNPIPGVWIEVPNSDGPTISDLDGTFTINCMNPKKQKLTASYAGMNQRKVKIKDGMRIKMKESSWRTPPSEWNTFVEAMVAIPTVKSYDDEICNPAYGLMVGRVKKWGYYVKGVTNFFKRHDSWKEYEYAGSMLLDKQRYEYWSATAGGIVRLGCPLHLYLGAGFSSYQYKVRSLSGDWYDVYDQSQDAFTIDFGLMFRIKKVTISLGTNGSFFARHWCEWCGKHHEDIKCAGNFGIGYSF